MPQKPNCDCVSVALLCDVMVTNWPCEMFTALKIWLVIMLNCDVLPLAVWKEYESCGAPFTMCCWYTPYISTTLFVESLSDVVSLKSEFTCRSILLLNPATAEF